MRAGAARAHAQSDAPGGVAAASSVTASAARAGVNAPTPLARRPPRRAGVKPPAPGAGLGAKSRPAQCARGARAGVAPAAPHSAVASTSGDAPNGSSLPAAVENTSSKSSMRATWRGIAASGERRERMAQDLLHG